MKPPTHTLPKLYIGNDNKTNTDPIISHTYVVRESVHIGDTNRKIQFMKFAKRLAQEKRFVMLKNVYVSHIRLFLLNFGSSKCVDKYL
ncbi:hypothetical protein L3Y34_014289 [Caenorhabditis briggsae]|uniref:Uncharacterized protein n=1 Tax=Caenorhabditis briggsae TaxID=6238 RepID=A0AAE9DRQ3_CAEBR|nr:hypothetical protein L3Y34_014289 [Caenorhabditis briggsae]